MFMYITATDMESCMLTGRKEEMHSAVVLEIRLIMIMIKHCCFYFISKLFNADYELGSYYFMYHSYLYYNYVVYICSLCRNLQ